MTLSELLTERGYVHQFTAEKLGDITDGEKRTVYLGIDPSADSLHVGNLQAMLVLRRFLEDGHKVILLVGGGTGMIGDPSGKSEERNLLDDEAVQANAAAIQAQCSKLFGGLDFTMVNNADWLKDIRYIEFLRDIGKHFSVNAMLQRDSVKTRLESQEQGISYTEFSYMLLQAYDYLHLHTSLGCDVQIGSSDQWGNITSGVDLIRRKTGHVAHAFTSPLLINAATGKKFGKSEQGAVWLDSRKTTPLQFYQFFMNVEDASLRELMLKLTLMPLPDVEATLREHGENPGKRIGQKALALSLTELVHGRDAAERALRASELLFGEIPKNGEEWTLLAEEADATSVAVGMPIVDVLLATNLATSKREGREFLEQGAISINGVGVGIDHLMSEADFVQGHAVVKRGKRTVGLIRLG